VITPRAARFDRLRRLLAAALIALGAAGCETRPAAAPAAPPVSAAAAPPAAQHPVLLWRAEVGASVLYLLGSVHVARPDLYPLDARIERAFAESGVLVLELDLDEKAQFAAAEGMIAAARLPAGKRLADVVAPETWRLFEQKQAERGQSTFGLRGFHPWFVALTLTTQALEAAGFSAEHGIDEHFRARAVGQKRIVALETVEEQLAFFTGLSPETEETMLRQTLEELDQYAAELDSAFRAWTTGDAQAIDELLIAPMRREHPEVFEQLFTARNRRMTAKLASLLKDAPDRYFVVVGAGHLIGTDGIVDLLRAQGIVAARD
jgi:uncharacterized protein YbaP (TraB family)